MLRKRKKQLRYAADQIIPNPRRSASGDDEESQRDVVHLKRRDVVEARAERPKRFAKDKSNKSSNGHATRGTDGSDAAADSQSSPAKSTAAVDQVDREAEQSDTTLSQVVSELETELLEFDTDHQPADDVSAPELPHPNDATVEFDELDELLLAEEDEELEEAIRRRLQTERNRKANGSTTDPAVSFRARSTAQSSDSGPSEYARQRINDLEEEREAAQREVEELRAIAEKAQQDRHKIQKQAEHDRRQAEEARQEQEQIQQSAEQDRLLAEKARKDQIEIRERSEKERAQLKETIETIRDRSQKAEAERLAVLESIEQEREELNQKLEQERELAREAAKQRKGLLQKTEQQRIEVRAAMDKQQSEARRLAEEAVRLDDEAKALEKERLDIVQKAQQERLEAEKLLEKEREQVRLVGEQWHEIAQRAASEHEKIRKLVDIEPSSTSAIQSPNDVSVPAPTDSKTVDKDPAITADTLSGRRDAALTDAQRQSRKLAEQEKSERALREQALREQTRGINSERRTDTVDTEAVSEYQLPAADLPVDTAPGVTPKPNRFTDDSGTGQSLRRLRDVDGVNRGEPDSNLSEAVYSDSSEFRFEDASRSGSEGQPAVEATKENQRDTGSPQLGGSERSTESQAKKQPESTSPAARSRDAKVEEASAGSESIPVLESKTARARATRSAFMSGDGLRSMALAATVFVVVLVGSSFAFFGYLNLDSWLDRETAVSIDSPGSDQSLLARIGQRFVELRSRVFGTQQTEDSPQQGAGEDDGESFVAESPMVAENAPIEETIDADSSVLLNPAQPTSVEQSVSAEVTAGDVLTGRVVSDAGTAVAGLTVTALARKFFVDPKGSSGGVNYRTRTDDQGNFSLRVPPNEEYRVATEGTDQFAPVSARVTPGNESIDLVLDPLNGDLSVTGRIFTDALDPIASARATTQFEPMQEVYSDDDGVYSIKVKRPSGGSDDTLVLRFEATGFHDGIMHLPANVWKAGKSISHDVFLDSL